MTNDLKNFRKLSNDELARLHEGSGKELNLPFSMSDETIVACRRIIIGSFNEFAFDSNQLFSFKLYYIPIVTYSNLTKPKLPLIPPLPSNILALFHLPFLFFLKTQNSESTCYETQHKIAHASVCGDTWIFQRHTKGLYKNELSYVCARENLLEESLSLVASQLNLTVNPKTSNSEYNTSGIATLRSRSPEKISSPLNKDGNIKWNHPQSVGEKIVMNLFSNLGLGKPEAVRRLRFVLL
ncbi:hypothetical protein SPOG_02216 [Schizosaccharomyces cryophilus OY26]|uniref:Uncharacterized protein n=1 Tax=Schizosaccharomyces cryophilus (strain OY26 / ATCC MYA-4695 / CBS 11777 / NBRC 106824 / NRRL Y48691) TaxID=653667 RepID=S9VT44_SCHCR|nr:uncharacterized protein SPOG_02216 [Schizosaccharomyces cryophilus OY26]EPY51038.1 hypothetical protein SPOG_02216 [Schizosaccharomyces cryophilus OY26]